MVITLINGINNEHMILYFNNIYFYKIFNFNIKMAVRVLFPIKISIIDIVRYETDRLI